MVGSPKPTVNRHTTWERPQEYYVTANGTSPTMRYGSIASAPPTTLSFQHQQQDTGQFRHAGEEQQHYALYRDMPFSAGFPPQQRPMYPHEQVAGMHAPQDFQPYSLDHLSKVIPMPPRPHYFAQQGYLSPTTYTSHYSVERHAGAPSHMDGSISPHSISPCPSPNELSQSPPTSGYIYEYPSSASSLPTPSSVPNVQAFAYMQSIPQQQHPEGFRQGLPANAHTRDSPPLATTPNGLAGPSNEDLKSVDGQNSGNEGDIERLPQGTPFISKLLHLLNNDKYRDYIRWNVSGDAFILSHTNQYFASQVLPIYFRHSNTSSFVRQLNLYGFNRLPIMQLLETLDDGSAGLAGSTARELLSFVDNPGFSHPYLHRDNQEMSKLIKPKASSSKRDRAASSSAKSPLSRPRSLSKTVPKNSKLNKRCAKDDDASPQPEIPPSMGAYPNFTAITPVDTADWNVASTQPAF